MTGSDFFACSQETGGTSDIWLDHIQAGGLTKSYKYTPAKKSMCIVAAADGASKNRFFFLNEDNFYVLVTINMATGVGHTSTAFYALAGATPIDFNDNLIQGITTDSSMSMSDTSDGSLPGVYVGGLATKIKQSRQT